MDVSSEVQEPDASSRMPRRPTSNWSTQLKLDALPKATINSTLGAFAAGHQDFHRRDLHQ